MTKPFAIINDTHGGAVRAGGTTPTTAFALRQWVLEQIRGLLALCAGHDLLINGDLLDTDHIPYSDLLDIMNMLCEWMLENPDSILYLPPGNHDLAKTTTTMSSQQFLASLLVGMFGSKRVVVPVRGQEISVAGKLGYVIPHMPNQEQFNIELDKVPECEYLFLHCNFDNTFAVQQDHSLNLSKEQAQACKAKRIVLGHEHQQKIGLGGKVMIPGNQFPTSVADCLGNSKKVMTFIDDAGLHMEETWAAEGSYCTLDWRALGEADASAQFIRVEGEATASEAPSVVTAISKLRKVHNAFVITNAVKVEGRGDMGEAMSMEKVANFNVVSALMERLQKKNPAWAKKVKAIMEKNNVSAA